MEDAIFYINSCGFSLCYSYNYLGFGVAIMGKYNSNNKDCMAALEAAQLLFKYLQEKGRLKDDFIVYGLRQVRPVESPAMELHKAIQSWPQWVRKLIFNLNVCGKRIHFRTLSYRGHQKKSKILLTAK
jgi:hypothetical protein